MGGLTSRQHGWAIGLKLGKNSPAQGAITVHKYFLQKIKGGQIPNFLAWGFKIHLCQILHVFSMVPEIKYLKNLLG